MKTLRVVAVGLAAVLALAACKKILNSSDDSFHTRMVNLIEDSPTVQYKLETTIIASTPYQAPTALAAARPGSHSVSFQAIRPASLVATDPTDPIDLGGSFDRSYTKNTDYTIFAYGKLDDVKTFVVDEPSDKAAVIDDNIEVEVIDADPNLPSVGVYITAPEAQITTPESLGTLAFGDKTAARTMKLYQRADVTDSTADLFTDLTFELRDVTGAVLFTSAPIRVTEKSRIMVAITHNIGPGPSTAQLIGLDGITGVYTNTADQVAVRFVNVSADSVPMDVIRGSSLSTPLAQNVAFRDRSSYVNVPDGDVDLIGFPTGATGLNFLFLEEFQATQGLSYTSYAIGPLATVDAEVLTDSRRSVPTQSSFRFLNAAPSLDGSDGLDIYVTVPGLVLDFDSTDDKDTTDDAPQFKRAGPWTYKSSTDYTIYKPATYQVRFMATGTTRVVLDTTITLPAGGLQTYVLLDDPDTGALELMPVDDTI
ncbi:MAG: DUF4397 domain-containing protein [Gammaproteobacteria bacterium]